MHKNADLSDTFKFHQLRTHLKDVALDTIRGYQIQGTNYASAWADLLKRFDRKDELVQEYIRRFLEAPGIVHKPNFHKLRTIIDTTNQMLRALPAQNVEVSNWDPVLLLVITTKLDEETRQDWKQHVGKKSSVTASELLDFLETKAFELQPTQSDRLSMMLKGDVCRRTPRKIFAVEKEPKPKTEKKLDCSICHGPHHIWNCDKLRAECAKARTAIIRDLEMCFRCLLKHQFGECEEDCAYCGGAHHVMLCYKKEDSQKQSFPDNRSFPRGQRPKGRGTWQQKPNHKGGSPQPKPPAKRDDGDWN